MSSASQHATSSRRPPLLFYYHHICPQLGLAHGASSLIKPSQALPGRHHTGPTVRVSKYLAHLSKPSPVKSAQGGTELTRCGDPSGCTLGADQVLNVVSPQKRNCGGEAASHKMVPSQNQSSGELVSDRAPSPSQPLAHRPATRRHSAVLLPCACAARIEKPNAGYRTKKRSAAASWRKPLPAARQRATTAGGLTPRHGHCLRGSLRRLSAARPSTQIGHRMDPH